MKYWIVIFLVVSVVAYRVNLIQEHLDFLDAWCRVKRIRSEEFERRLNDLSQRPTR
jgi:hypothetical protein